MTLLAGRPFGALQAGSAEHLHRHTHFLGGSSETAFQVPRTGSKVSSFSSLLACRADHSWSIDMDMQHVARAQSGAKLSTALRLPRRGALHPQFILASLPGLIFIARGERGLGCWLQRPGRISAH
jgi:hypothetical protein